jgi:hypothetical protein
MFLRAALILLVMSIPAYARKITEMNCVMLDNSQRFDLINDDGRTAIRWDNGPWHPVTIEFKEQANVLTVIQIASDGTFRMMVDAKTLEGYGQTRFSNGKVREGRLLCRW